MGSLQLSLRMISSLFLVQIVWAQITSEPQTIQECLAALKAFPAQQVKLAREAGKKPNYQEISQAKIEIAKKYSAQFKVDTVSAKDLILLSQLFLEATQNEMAVMAITKSLSQNTLSPEERAEALGTAINIHLAKSPSDEQLKQAEIYMSQLDGMGTAFVKQQLRAHSRLGGYYSYADIDAKNLEHHEKILSLLRPLSPEDKKEFRSLPINAYQSIALVQANRGDIAKAIETLQRGKAELGDAAEVKWLEQGIQRYTLIGKAGAALKADYWLNTVASKKEFNLPGKVTLMQFTAHWCGPCRKSYPAMLRYQERYGKKGLQVVFSTELYGFFEKQQNLTAEAEMTANRNYYLEHHKIPFPIAVQAKTESKPDEPLNPNRNETQYFVGGIPQIVLLDRNGIVRLIMIGWDPANEQRTTQLIEELLKQPSIPKTQQ